MEEAPARRVGGGLLDGARPRLESIHRAQVQRDPWPEFESFDAARYPVELRAPAARQWMRRAREELGSVYEFTAVMHALARARAPIEILGSLARLVTDEVRHAEMCGRMARACWPEGEGVDPDPFAWPAPALPFPAAPPLGENGDVEPTLAWAAEAILSSCCIGETLSRPLFESVATVCTDPVCESVLRQVLRDEHLHATFGWETLEALLPRLTPASRTWLEERLAVRLAQFERGATKSIDPRDLADTVTTIEPGDPAHPNLATLTPRQYAAIFYSTLETEILPRFTSLGFDAHTAWSTRNSAR